jgi:hypothetical protein
MEVHSLKISGERLYNTKIQKLKMDKFRSILSKSFLECYNKWDIVEEPDTQIRK